MANCIALNGEIDLTTVACTERSSEENTRTNLSAKKHFPQFSFLTVP